MNWIIIAAIEGALIIILGYALYDLRKKFFRLFQKEVPETQTEALAQIFSRADIAEKGIASLEERADILESIGAKSFQKVGFMRFNPFQDTGGDQSFSLALLDNENNGVIISSLYGREGNRVYAKAVDHGIPKQAISGEEKEVLEQAMNK